LLPQLQVPIIPGSDPRIVYGDLAGRGVKGMVLEAFGVGMDLGVP
jgi:L-asparaginase/Glu-tRNA(Gln) amidotransferase subunit D